VFIQIIGSRALRATQLGERPVSCFTLSYRAPLKGGVSGVALGLEVEQLKLKIPGVGDARRLVRRRPGGEHGATEESPSVLLSFEHWRLVAP
jgi:hypothetical protein